MSREDLASKIVALRPFVPAKDFDESKRFYEALGFRSRMLGSDLVQMQFGAHEGEYSFLLQKFYVKEFAENFMMHLLVRDLDVWWAHIASIEIAKNFKAPAPRPPALQPWGLMVAYVVDPTGVLWHVAQDRAV